MTKFSHWDWSQESEKNQFVGTLAPNTVQEITPNLTIIMDSATEFSATETHTAPGNWL